ncbi:hypothetical protein K443DRAFT_682119 [Laccaria amethystina LaAM-08-1]|uniref:Secreted protein n=1 Tax=Laccaria amethystina LaAM-08-1 TaxID=1095629 RepID=A0A0C9XGB1_9AGAR|nr:hypothetical protein K443DRAFT_682119 [Laccaria amethystina LaAM-08-1]
MVPHSHAGVCDWLFRFLLANIFRSFLVKGLTQPSSPQNLYGTSRPRSTPTHMMHTFYKFLDVLAPWVLILRNHSSL